MRNLFLLLVLVLSGCNESIELQSKKANSSLNNAEINPEPASITLISPASSPSQIDTPSIRVSGVLPGNIIKLFTDSNCTTEVGSEMAISVSADFSLAALPEGSYDFYANSTSPSLDVSDCSLATLNYVVDQTSSADPSGLALSNPSSSPGFDSTPEITVSGVVSGDTVRLFTDSSCSTQVASGIASGSSINLTSSAISEGAHNFYADSTDTAGNQSGCSSATISYTLDTTAPSAPSGLALNNPATSPSNDTTPEIRISGVVSGDTVRLFTDSSCSNQVALGVASGVTIDLTSSALTDGSYNFYANSSDPVGNTSGCSGADVAYVLDSTAPSAPSGLALSDPSTSPGADDTPEIRISGVVNGDTVSLYTDSSCSTQVASGVATGTFIDLTSSTVTGSTTFYARSTDPLGNNSLCSALSVTYVLDNVAPSAPSGLALNNPASSPGTDSTPEITVSGVVSGDIIRLYTDSSCSTEVGSGTASGTSINITSSALTEGTHDFYARSEDTLGNTSACSASTVTYVLDTTAPSAPSGLALNNPATSPSNDTTPEITVNGVVSGDTVRLFTDSSCSTQVATGTASGTSIDLTSSVLTDGSYDFYAESEDAASNVSSCSTATVAFEIDVTAPSAPSGLALNDPATSPGTDSTPEITVTGVVSGDSVKLFTDSSCSTQVASGIASGASLDLTTGPLTPGTYDFYANSEDYAGNVSGCSTATVEYEYANPPAAPSSLSLNSPSTSPGNDTTPRIRVSGVTSGDTVRLFTDSSCTTQIGTGVASAANIDITTTPLVEGSYSLYANSEDTLGNFSVCSSATVSYVLDVTPPSTPNGLTLNDPLTSPNNNSTPKIRISGIVVGDTIRIYTDASCINEVGSKTKGGSGTTVNIISTPLTEALHNFYATSEDSAGNKSACSTATVAYEYDSSYVVEEQFTDLAVAGEHTCGLTNSGNTFCWGNNDDYQIGDTTTSRRLTPTSIDSSNMTSGESFVDISGKYETTCGLTNKGNIYCWGKNYYGEAGDPSLYIDVEKPQILPSTNLAVDEKFTSLTVGTTHACALTDLGNAYCWGRNTWYMLGDNTSNSTHDPVAVIVSNLAIGEKFLSLNASSTNTCGLTNFGNAFCWGENGRGTVGDGTTTDRKIPTAVNLTNLDANESLTKLFESRGQHQCALTTESNLYCWGYNASSQVGDNTSTNRTIPTAVNLSNLASNEKFTSLSGGNNHSCGITNMGNSYCWGWGYALGTGATTSYDLPTSMVSEANMSADEKLIKIFSGSSHSCGISTSGKTYCWGIGGDGRLGNNSQADNLEPVAVDTTNLTQPMKFLEVSTYGNHSCGITSSGKVFCWGDNSNGQLGDSTFINKASPTEVDSSNLATNEMFTSVTVGKNHSCGLTNLYKAFCWGSGSVGQLGTGSILPNQDIPMSVDSSSFSPSEVFTKLASGNLFSCGLTNLSNIYCWGEGALYRLGNGSSTTKPKPEKVTLSNLAAGEKFIDFDSDTHSCAVTNYSNVFCWGNNTFGQIGDGTTINRDIPYQIDSSNLSGNEKFKSVSVGEEHSCGVTNQSRVYCWGKNSNGEIGDDSTINRSIPESIDMSNLAANEHLFKVFLGGNHSCAISSLGSTYCWGLNSSYQVFSGTQLDQTKPIAVETVNLIDETYISLTLGELHTCGLTSSGNTYCRGDNSANQLGSGTIGGSERYAIPIDSSNF